jgi:hypothetical protein
MDFLYKLYDKFNKEDSLPFVCYCGCAATPGRQKTNTGEDSSPCEILQQRFAITKIKLAKAKLQTSINNELNKIYEEREQILTQLNALYENHPYLLDRKQPVLKTEPKRKDAPDASTSGSSVSVDSALVIPDEPDVVSELKLGELKLEKSEQAIEEKIQKIEKLNNSEIDEDELSIEYDKDAIEANILKATYGDLEEGEEDENEEDEEDENNLNEGNDGDNNDALEEDGNLDEGNAENEADVENVN